MNNKKKIINFIFFDLFGVLLFFLEIIRKKYLKNLLKIIEGFNSTNQMKSTQSIVSKNNNDSDDMENMMKTMNSMSNERHSSKFYTVTQKSINSGIYGGSVFKGEDLKGEKAENCVRRFSSKNDFKGIDGINCK